MSVHLPDVKRQAQRGAAIHPHDVLALLELCERQHAALAEAKSAAEWNASGRRETPRFKEAMTAAGIALAAGRDAGLP